MNVRPEIPGYKKKLAISKMGQVVRRNQEDIKKIKKLSRKYQEDIKKISRNDPTISRRLSMRFIIHLMSIRRMRVSVQRKNQPHKLTSEEQKRAVAMLLSARSEGKSAIETLGLHPSANRADVRKRFRHLSLLVHPDKNTSADAAEAFKILSEAFKSAR